VKQRLPGYSADRNAYFGDLHVHTQLSFDAYIFNVRRSPDDAYRFAKGEAIGHAQGMTSAWPAARWTSWR
jgi:predicted metal-dependent phosphoesterase TrpH